jgi:hypothetical protein
MKTDICELKRPDGGPLDARQRRGVAGRICQAGQGNNSMRPGVAQIRRRDQAPERRLDWTSRVTQKIRDVTERLVLLA